MQPRCLIVFAGACLVACTESVPRGPFAPPAAAQLEPESTALPSNGLAPAFTTALGRYQRALKKVGTAKADHRPAAMRAALARLAEAIRTATPAAPYPTVVQPLSNLHGYRIQMVDAPPMTAQAAGGQALVEASRALSRLARGPYAGAPLVNARAHELATTAAIASERLMTDGELLRGLHEAERVLGAMYAAATAEPEVYGLPGENTDLPH